MRDCLVRDGARLISSEFGRFITAVETSIASVLADDTAMTERQTRDALREIWLLAADEDPSVGVLRIRVSALPAAALRYLDARAHELHRRALNLGRSFFAGLVEHGLLCWSASAPPQELLKALRLLTADGGKFVQGRRRGMAKRSAPKFEPLVFGEARGHRTAKGGRPSGRARHDLVMFLAVDWYLATGRMPKRGRSDNRPFGDFVHLVFQTLGPQFCLNEEAAAETAEYELRRYWNHVDTYRNYPPLNEFLARQGEQSPKM